MRLDERAADILCYLLKQHNHSVEAAGQSKHRGEGDLIVIIRNFHLRSGSGTMGIETFFEDTKALLKCYSLDRLNTKSDLTRSCENANQTSEITTPQVWCTCLGPTRRSVRCLRKFTRRC